LPAANSPQSFTFTVGVSNSAGQTASASLTLAVQPPITVTTNAPASFQFIVGTNYVQPPNGNNSITFQASGGTAPYTWVGISLPTGLILDHASGVIVGTPTQQGTFAATITATDSQGRTGSARFNLSVVTTPLLITTGTGQTPATLPSGMVGVAYNQFLDASGGSNAGYQWTTVGTLPPGLTAQVNSNATCTSSCSFQISGTPTQAGTFNFTVQLKDSLGNAAQQSFSLIINSGTPPQITVSTLTLATIGQAYSFSFTATGGAGGYVWSFVGPAPDPGLQLSSAGLLQGTSTVANDCPTGPAIWIGNQPPFGNFSSTYFQVQVTDSAGQSANKQFCLPAYYPAPQVASVTPASIPSDGQTHVLTVSGTNFRSNSAVYIQGKGFVPTTYVNATTLTFSITTDSSNPSGTYTFWIVQPYANVSNMDKSFTIQ